MERDRFKSKVKYLIYEAGWTGDFLLLDHAVDRAPEMNETDTASYVLRAMGDLEEQRVNDK